MFKHIEGFHKAISDPISNKRLGCENPSQKHSMGKWKESPFFEIMFRGELWRFFRHPELYLSSSALFTVGRLNRERDFPSRYNETPAIEDEILETYDEALEACLKLKKAGETKS